MTLEATMIILDNSDWSRNGDFFPSRWSAQHDSANVLAETKCSLNVESSVGLMTMAGKRVEMLVTPLNDPGRILTSLHNVKLGGRIQLTNSLQIAQLALKHRMNKNQKQRIIVFIASPVEEEEKALVSIGSKFKKNNVAIDIINLEVGVEDQSKKLKALVDAANSSDNSHFVEGQPGMQMLYDTLLTSPICQGSEGAGIGGGVGGDFGGPGQMDPELEMAIRISLEEEKARNARKETDTSKEANPAAAAAAQADEAGKMQVEGEVKPAAESNTMAVEKEGQAQNANNDDDDDEDDEEELMRRAKELSLQEPAANAGEPSQFSDPSFVNDLLKDLELDEDDPTIKEALENAKKQDENRKDDKDRK